RDFREEKEAIIRPFGGEKYPPLCSGRLLRHVALPRSPVPGNIEVTGPPRHTARYAGFRAVADERNGSPIALMQSLKHSFFPTPDRALYGTEVATKGPLGNI